MRAIIGMTLGFFFLTIPLSVLAYRESDLTCGIFAVIVFLIASLLLWQLTRKYRSDKRGFWVSVGLVLLSLFIPVDP